MQADRSTISFRVERVDLEWWLKEPMPVILVVYDALSEIAYWLYIQAYFEERGKTDPSKLGVSQTVHLLRANVLDQGAVRQFARYRDTVLAQTKEVIHYHA